MAVTFHNVEQRSEEWLRLKLAKVGGTRMKSMLSSSNLSLVDELIAEKLTGEVETFFINDAMQTGIDREPYGIASYEEKMGVDGYDIGLVTNDLYPLLCSSPDKYVGSNGALEIKCPMVKTHIKYIRMGGVPVDHRPQILMYFIINPDIEWVDFVSYNPDVEERPLYIYRVWWESVAWDIQDAIKVIKKFEKKFEKHYNQVIF